MRLSIRPNGSNLIEFNQITLSGRSGAGGYALNFVLRGSRRACEKPLVIFDIRLSVALSDSRKPLVLAIPSGDQIVQCPNCPSNDEQVYFEAVLSKEQINALEECRQEGDLKLNLGLRALTSSSDGLNSSFDAADFLIAREHWLNALQGAGYRKTLLFEIPLPALADDTAAAISKAQEFIETGHYKDAVMQCRRIIEELERFRDDKKQAIAASKMSEIRENREAMTSIERLLCLREQLKNICQLGAHGRESFTRSQARAVLGMTITLLAEPTVGFSEGLGCQKSE